MTSKHTSKKNEDYKSPIGVEKVKEGGKEGDCVIFQARRTVKEMRTLLSARLGNSSRDSGTWSLFVLSGKERSHMFNYHV